MLITVIVFCENLEQTDDNVDQSLIIGVLSKLLPFFVNDKGEKTCGDREKLTDTKEKWRETRAVYFLSDNRFVISLQRGCRALHENLEDLGPPLNITAKGLQSTA